MSVSAELRGERVHRLSDFAPPAWRVPTIDLRFDLDPAETLVTSRMKVRRQSPDDVPLRLDGRDLTLLSVSIDGRPLALRSLEATPDGLQLAGVPREAEIEIVTRLCPGANRSAMGLHSVSDVLITQCEPEGFRRLTYFPDRPDVLSVYTVTLVDRTGRLPVLLANGNRVADGVTPEGHRWVRWHDPHPKSCYLFALAAGALGVRRTLVPVNGRFVELGLYAPLDLLESGHLAVETLAQVMQWDYETYGREYDLDVLNLVVVRDFEGAMENKGLIVTGPALASFDPALATDWDRLVLQNTVAHEYLHNWTGNRVACRDWFQLGLKEGLTTFRHWQFAEDAGEPDMKRIWQVRLYAEQVFAEDAGARAHAVRPREYEDVSNLFTATVYKKGAEIARMLHTALGTHAFRAGMDLYFSRCDGQAVTFEDWLSALSHVTGRDLSAYAGWLATVGSPTLCVDSSYDPESQQCILTLTRRMAATGEAEVGDALPIPLSFGMLDETGRPMTFRLDGELEASPETRTVVFESSAMRLLIHEVARPPVPSLLRGFSAPVHLSTNLGRAERRMLASCDPDPVARWMRMQEFMARSIGRVSADDTVEAGQLVDLFGTTLRDPAISDLVRHQLLVLPELVTLREQSREVDMSHLDESLRAARRSIAEACREDLVAAWNARPLAPYRADPVSMGARRIRNLCLGLLVEHFPDEFGPAAFAQLCGADNMTDVQASLEALCHTTHVAREPALEWFARRWGAHDVAMEKWLQAQARSRRRDVLAEVAALANGPVFDCRRPGSVRALLRTFAMENPAPLHAQDGSGYRFLAEQQARLDAFGEKSAAWSHLLDEFALAPRLARPLRDRMIEVLRLLLADPAISSATRETAARCLRTAEAAP